MDILSYYYFTELCKDLNMSRTAERLYVSQQTISNHIQRMEEHYGTSLFHRKPSLSLTYAGKYALQFSQRLLREEKNLEDFLDDVEKKVKGVLRFGASSLRLNDSFPFVLPAFSALYPEVELRITASVSAHLEPMVLEGKLDLAIVLDNSHINPNLERFPFTEDSVFLCISDKLLKGKKDDAWKRKALGGVDLAECTDFPLCHTENRIGDIIRQFFVDEGIEPKIYMSSTDSNLSYLVGSLGVAGSFITHNRLVNVRKELPPDMNIFPLRIKGRPVVQKLILIRRRDRYASEPMKYFMKLLQDSAHEMASVDIARIS